MSRMPLCELGNQEYQRAISGQFRGHSRDAGCLMTRVDGYIRFSYLGRSDARASRNGLSDAERAAVIYAPLRMAQRFHLFEHICLPSLRAQTHPDFRISVLASPQMPESDRARLEVLVAALPQGRVLYSTAESVVEALNPVITDVTGRAQGMTYHFRLDDDDALCTTAIQTRQMEKHFPFKAKHLRWVMQTLPVAAPLAPEPASG
jgi:hypothetical protein